MDHRNIRAVLFDFDGVICQTEVFRMDRREAFLKELGLRVDRRALYRMVGGSNMTDRTAQMDAIFGSQPLYRQNRDAVLAHRVMEFRYPDILTPGLVPALAHLREGGLRLAVVSNSREEVIDAALRECGIREAFAGIVSGWDSPLAKPDPHIYLEAMKQLDLPASRCVVVEDSAVGIRAGKAAGCYVAALRDRDGLIDQSAADVVLADIRELPPLLGL